MIFSLLKYVTITEAFGAGKYVFFVKLFGGKVHRENVNDTLL